MTLTLKEERWFKNFIAQELANKRTVCYQENCDSTVALPTCSKHQEEALQKALGLFIKKHLKREV
jgi:hypothetical protein